MATPVKHTRRLTKSPCLSIREEPAPVEKTDDECLVKEGRAGVPVTLGLAVQRQRAAELEEDEDEDDDGSVMHFLVLYLSCAASRRRVLIARSI